MVSTLRTIEKLPAASLNTKALVMKTKEVREEDLPETEPSENTEKECLDNE